MKRRQLAAVFSATHRRLPVASARRFCPSLLPGHGRGTVVRHLPLSCPPLLSKPPPCHTHRTRPTPHRCSPLCAASRVIQGAGLNTTDEQGLICCNTRRDSLSAAGSSQPTSQPGSRAQSQPGSTRASGVAQRRQPQPPPKLGASPRWCLDDSELEVAGEPGSPLSPWAWKAPPSAERRSLPFSSDESCHESSRAHAAALNQLSPRPTRDVNAERAVLLL